jgi:hypothetical protein
MLRTLSRKVVRTGFVSTTSAAREGSVIGASKNLLFDSSGRSKAYPGPSVRGEAGNRVLFNSPDGTHAGLGTAAAAGIGSIVGLVARAIAFIGTGALYLNGVSRSVSASTALQILLYRSGAYTGAGTGPYTAGLDPPGAPTIAEHSITTSAINLGTTSAVLWFVRSATGGRSRSSLPSNVLVVNGKKVRLTVQSADLTTASTLGYDRLGIGLTQWGFGASGPTYEYAEIAISSLTTVDGVANSVELEWSSAGLSGKPFAPIDDYPPPASVFACALEDVVAVIGCYGDPVAGVSATSPGTAIAVSLPVFIESFPPDNLLFLPEPPTGVLTRAAGGFCFVACKNSLHALYYKGGTPALSLKTVWAQVGVQAQHNMALAEGGRLYAFTGKGAMVRIGERGEPETAWAADMAAETTAWTPANVVVGWDGDTQSIVFGHHKTLLAFNTQTGVWDTPVDLTASLTAAETLCAAVTVGGTLYFAARDTVTTANPIRLFNFQGGSGTTYEAYLPWEESEAHRDVITRLDVTVRCDNTTYPVNLRIYKDGDFSAPAWSKAVTPTRTGLVHLPTQRPNVRGARSHSVYVSQRSVGGTGMDSCGVDSVETRGVSTMVV